MFRRTYRNFELEATHAREGGYVVRISRKGALVHELGGDEKGRGAYEGPDIALDWAVDWRRYLLLRYKRAISKQYTAVR